MRKVLKRPNINKLILLTLIAWMVSHPIFLYSHAQQISKTDNKLKTDIQLKINGKDINSNYEVLLQNDRLMVPMRVVAESLGVDIKWNEQDKSVVMQSQERKITLFIDKLEADIDGKSVELDVKPFLLKDRTMVPIRFIAESLSCSVRWDNATRTAWIDKKLSEHDKVEFEVITDFSKHPFLGEYGKDHSKYAYGRSFEKDGYSYVIICYREQNSGGYSVKVDGVYLLEQGYGNQKVFVVKSHLQAPAPDAVVTMALTYPKAIIRFENKTAMEVRIPFDSNVKLGEPK